MDLNRASSDLRSLIKQQQAKLDDRAERIGALARQVANLKRERDEARVEAAQLAGVVRRIIGGHTALRELPPESLRLHVGTRTTAANFLLQGAESSERVIEVFGETPPGPVLDWGCGSGRTLNWLLLRPGWDRLYRGCDIDHEAIAWLNFKGFDCVTTCNPNPPLPYPDAAFAGLFAFSVLTHIPPESHRIWYREIARVLGPGGKAFLTIQGEAVVAAGIVGSAETVETYRRQGWAYEIHEGHCKDAALVSPDFTRKAFAGILEEENYAVAGYHRMDAFILTKA